MDVCMQYLSIEVSGLQYPGRRSAFREIIHDWQLRCGLALRCFPAYLSVFEKTFLIFDCPWSDLFQEDAVCSIQPRSAIVCCKL